MKLELVKKIKELIDAYHANAEIQQDEIRKVIEPFKNPAIASRYTPEGLRETIHDGMQDVINNWKKINIVYNQKLKAIIADAKEQLLPMVVKNIEKPADYAARVNNALQFLQLEGHELTDETAFDILKNFQDDYDQMKLFEKVVSKYVDTVDYATGGTNFPKTFGKSNKVKTLMNTFTDLESEANMLFVYQMSDGETVILGNNRFSLPVDGYAEIVAETNILEPAAAIDEMAADMIESSTED